VANVKVIPATIRTIILYMIWIKTNLLNLKTQPTIIYLPKNTNYQAPKNFKIMKPIMMNFGMVTGFGFFN
jgi:hypothetical protein